MPIDDPSLERFLGSTTVVDWRHAAVSAQARALARPDPVVTARVCFEFVRDQIKHSRDHELDPATWRASDVLKHGTGYCYAKSHLLAALLRANGLPAGFCYQRLSVNDSGPPYSLHGFNAVHLPGAGWYRIDARGNKPGVNAQFTPPVERLAFAPQCEGEFEFTNVFADPLNTVLDALRASTGWRDALDRLPDVEPPAFDRAGLTVRSAGRPGGA